MKHNVNFGIIGCGMISVVHAEALEAVSGAVLRGVFDRSSEKCAAFAEKYGAIAYESMETMLSDRELDAICICTPSGAHAEYALAAMAAGKHVLIEKPLALRLEDCDKLMEAEKRYGVKASVVSQLRFAETTEILKALVKDGALGRIVSAELSMKYYRAPSYYADSQWRGTKKGDGGGALMNQGIHGIDTLLAVMGKVKTVYGMARTLAHQIEVEDTAAAVVEFENGALGLIQGTTSVSPGYPRILTLSGTGGTVSVTENRFTEWSIEGRTLPEGITLGGEICSGAKDPRGIGKDGHVAQITDFVCAIQNDRSPKVSLADGRKTVALIMAIYESSEKNCPIQFI